MTLLELDFRILSVYGCISNCPGHIVDRRQGRDMTIREIARKAGVSAATVSIVLNGKRGVSDGTRRKVQKLIEEYGYEPVGRRHMNRKTILALIYVRSGILVEENQGFITSILSAMQTHLESLGYAFVTMHIDRPFPQGLEQIDFNQYSGMCLVASEIVREAYSKVEQIPIPYVILDNQMPQSPYPCIGINNIENVRLALEYVSQKGFQRIGLLKSSIFSENFSERELAFYRYAEEYKIKVDPKQIYELTPTLLGAHDDMERCLNLGAQPINCYFAENDMIALGAMSSFKEHGYHMPKDISVIGFDNIPFAEVSYPPLTTIDVRRDVIGMTAARVLLAGIDTGKQLPIKVAVSGHLIKRRSL